MRKSSKKEKKEKKTKKKKLINKTNLNKSKRGY